MALRLPALSTSSLMSGANVVSRPVPELQGSIPEFFRRRNEPPAKVQHHLKTQRSVHGVTYDSSIRRAGFRMLRRKAASDWKDSRKKFPVISSPPPARLEIGFLDQRVQVRLKLRLLLA